MINRAQAMVEAHRTRVGVIASAGAAVLAVVWLFDVPDKANEVEGIRAWAIRYAHSLCWAFLSAALALYAVRAPRPFIELTGWLGMLAYAAFILAVVW